jgi:hypothetical protein
MNRILTPLLLTICFCGLAFSQDDDRTEKTKQLLDQARKSPGARKLNSQITVNGNVHVEAVLIPRVDANRIFGKEIANNYAVIELNIGNKSPEAALIIHGVFIDYSQWPLSGSSRSVAIADRSTDSYQESNFPSQVASVEYRVVRGQLLDAQVDTWRNRLMRWLTLAGNLAGAFTFSINEEGIVKGIAAATGVGIPGVATAWPDRTIDQLNRVSDFGFRSPKLVPKEGSEVIVCFFPIDRFLTPGFRKIFLNRPAIFFAPFLMLADTDKAVKGDVNAAVGELIKGITIGGAPLTVNDLRQALPCLTKIHHKLDPGYSPCLDDFGLEEVPGSNGDRLRVKVDAGKYKTGEYEKYKKLMILEFIGGVSLNRVTVTIDGVMSVDVNAIAARVDEVEIEKVADCGDAGNECLWTNLTAGDGVRTGVIRGAYMKDGDIEIAEKDALSITDLKKIDEGSSDNELHFSFKLTSPLSNQTKLHFTVTKPAPGADTKKLESNAFEYLVAFSPTAPGIESASLSSDKKTVSVKIRRVNPGPVAFSLHPASGKDVAVPAASITQDPADKDKFVIDIDSLKLKAGCWNVQAQSGGLFSGRSERFGVEPKPSIDAAVRHDSLIEVTGTDLLDFSRCGGQRITFKLVKEGSTTPVALDVDWTHGKPLLKLPDDIKKDTAWKGKVQVYLDDVQKAEKELTNSQ